MSLTSTVISTLALSGLGVDMEKPVTLDPCLAIVPGDLFQCRMNIRNVDIKLDMEAVVIPGIPFEIRPGFRIASQTSLNV